MPQPPNKIKFYSGQTINNSIKNKNFILGINNAGNYGPTSSTGFWNGISPPTNGYTIYGNKPVGGPAIFVANNDTQLINFAKSMSGTNITGATQALTYYHTSNLLCVNRDYEDIVTSGLTFLVDAGFTLSYPRSGTSWTDLSYSGINGTLVNGPVYSGSNGGSITFDGVNDYVSFGNQNLGLDLISKSFSAWVYLGSTLANPTGIIDKDFDNGPGVYGGWGFWVGSDRKLWWWNMANQDIRDTGPTTIGTNVWTNIAVTYNSTTKTASFYINGTLNSSSSNSNISELSSGSQPLYVGSMRSLTGNFLNGRITNILAYNRVLSATEILQNYNAQINRFVPTPTPTPIPPTPTPIPPTPTPTSSTDPDAQAFITAAGITNPTQQSAINTLVVGLKTDGIWTKMMAIYPFVGGTATSHKYNLKDPRDLDVAYRLTFGGGWDHSSNGIGGNGANTYADTYIVNYNLGQIGVYSNAGNNAYYGGRYGLDYQYDSVYMFPYIGAIVENSYAVSYFSNSTDGGDAVVGFGGYNLGLTTIAGGDGTAKFYVNGSLNVDITPSANPSQLPISLWFGSPHLGYNMANPSYDFYSDGTFAFGFVSSSILNSTENANLYSRVQTYQTTLGRQV